ncbi:MAG TPA: immunoglobulin domain-containing protein, partial [Methylomirabilota bacterium]|nr:immunoglobulin domain-containing protein [Methylomirabilota bacterium]
MKKTLLLLSLCLAANRLAAFPFYDPFADRTASGGSSYAVGSNLATQNDGAGDVWNSVGGNFPGAEPKIAAGNLLYPNLPPSSGNSVSFVPAASMGDRLNFNATIPYTTTAYYSYILKITDLTAVPTSAANNFFAGFSDGNAGQTAQVARVGARVVTKKSGAGYVLGMSRNNTPADNVYDTTVYNVNDVVFLVGSYDRIGGVTNVNLWINPPGSTFGSNAAPAPTLSVTTVTSFTGDVNAAGPIQGFVVLCQNATAPSGMLDDLRIGTNWSFVTGGDPAVVQNPTNRTVPAGNNATFSVVARGTPTLTYQWYKDGSTPLSDGGNISGATTASLTVHTISAADVGIYSAFVTNGVGAFAQSAGASLSLLTDPIITAQPQDFTTNFGGSASFQVTAGGTPPFNYQWHKQGVGDLSDGPNITGSHSNILTLSGLAFPDGGIYSVTVGNSFANVDSTNAVLTVIDPYVTNQPVSITTNAGAVATFHVGATGSGPFTYQWLKNGNLLFDGGVVSGASLDTLTLTGVSGADAAGYSATIIGAFSSVTSSVANLNVLTPAAVLIQPSPRTVAPGVRAVFVVGAGGSGPFTYQWQREGTTIPDATAAAYVIANAQAGVAGNYRVVVSNSFSATTSSVVALTVTNNLSLSSNNLVVIRVGDGAQTQTLNGNSMYLDQFDVNGAYVNTVTIPESGPSGMVAIGLDNLSGINSGSTTGSGITRSLDNRFMVIAGYNTNLNYGASLNTSFSTNVPRGVALIDSHAQYTLAVADTNSTFDATLWRAAVSDG